MMDGSEPVHSYGKGERDIHFLVGLHGGAVSFLGLYEFNCTNGAWS
jgi:hypothetical protein